MNNSFWKTLILYIKIYWLRALLLTLAIAAAGGSIWFIYYCINSYSFLENFTKVQMAGHMALFFGVLVVTHIISMPLMMGMQFYFMQGGGMGKVNIHKAKVDVRWDEVIGLEAAKKEAWELVKLLKDRAMLKTVGGKIIKGTMMIGPPGCGKTYLAKAIAGECGLPLLPTVGSEFTGMFVGQGTARMKSLFKQARAMAQVHGGCIIFIDEIDSFARPRGADMGFGGGRLDMNSTINQFLTEMDGLRNAENNVVVIAATNVGEHELDSAIMRAGRFDRKIHFTKPNLQERKQIFDFYLAGYLGFTLDDFAGKKLREKKNDVEKLVNDLIKRSNISSEPISFKDVEDGISWLNHSIVPFKILANDLSNPQITEDMRKLLDRILEKYGNPIDKLDEEALNKLNQDIIGKKLKRLTIGNLFKHKTKRSLAPRVKYDENINTDVLAQKTVWFSPAEIESMVREAGLFALRDARDTLNMKDLSAAYDRVSFGQKSNIVLTQDEKISTAYHETGHAFIYYLIHPTDDVMKATIIPRAGALGFVFARPAEELHCKDREHLLAEIKVSIASYVVEKKKFNTSTTGVGGGASSDFQRALRLAHLMVWSYGMGDSGMIGDYHALSQHYGTPFISDKTKETLDQDTQMILQNCLKDVQRMIDENWEAVEYFAQELIKKEELEYDEIEDIFAKKFNLKPLKRKKKSNL